MKLNLMLFSVLVNCMLNFTALAIPADMIAFLQEESHVIAEDGALPSKLPQSMNFAKEVAANWRQTLKELPTIAPDVRRQSLIIVAAEFLPPQEYVEFVNALCDLRGKRKLAAESLRFVLWASMAKQGFLAYNFNNPSVAEVIGKLETNLNQDFPNEWTAYFTELKSGHRKEQLLQRLEGDGGRIPELMPENQNDRHNPNSEKEAEKVELIKPTKVIPLMEVSEVETIKEMSSVVPKDGTIPEDFRGVTEDPLVVELINKIQHNEIGKVLTATKDIQKLWYDDKPIFEAKRIGSRSISNGGMIVLDAVTGTDTPIQEAEVAEGRDDGPLVSSSRGVWVILPAGDRVKITPSCIDAFWPVVSPDGKKIAFTGRQLDDRGFPSKPRIYAGDLESGKYRVFSNEKNYSEYHVCPVDWTDEGNTLRVIQDHGETGGHMKLLQIRFND